MPEGYAALATEPEAVMAAFALTVVPLGGNQKFPTEMRI
jgi:hypothetical protein